MDGNKKTETCAQRSIQHCLEMIAPFEAPEVQKEEGFLQFYQFMVSIYQKMYRNPEDYLVFPKPYEEYIANRKGRNAQKKEKEHVTDSKESTLRNTFQQAIQFYASYFYQVGIKSKGIDLAKGSLIIDKEDYLDAVNYLSRIHQSHYNGQRYSVLSKLGIQVYENGGMVYLSHKLHSRIMEGVEYLCKAPDSKYRWMNFLRLDYKNAYAPVPAVDDICRTLPPESSRAVKMLEENLSGMKVKTKIKPLRGIVSDFKWKVEYIYKGKNICGFYADSNSFMLCIYFNHFQNITAFSDDLYEEDHELFQWFAEQFPERLCKCPNNRRVFFGGEPRRICGLSNRAEITNPADSDLDKALYLLRKYRHIC